MVDKIEWLESMHTLHGTVEILYVVTGYQISQTYDDSQVGDEITAPTLSDAIDLAIEAGWRPLTKEYMRELLGESK